VLDMDSSVGPNARRTGNGRLNGHYECTCYHPLLFVFNQFGDLERCALRPGNVHSADGWESVLRPVVARYRGKVSRIYFRTDVGFANSQVYELLETERIKYAIRLPANRILQERIGYVLKRPVGRPSHDVRQSYANLIHQAGTGRNPAGWSPRSNGILASIIRASDRPLCIFQMAEVVVSRHLFVDILRLIAELRPPPATSTAY
jgi:hypothetical protein